MNTCYNPFTLAGKTVLVTGASSGMGRATAIECSRMGAQLIITGRNEARLNEVLSKLDGEGHTAIAVDLTNPDDLKSLTGNIEKIDGMVLCAGITETVTTAFASRKKFNKIFETNFFSTVELIRLIQKGKKINSEGSIVIISSIAGNFVSNPGNGIYEASKAALSSWSRTMALELAVRQIRVNAICPGMVRTPLISPGAISEEQLKADEAKYPLKRYGNPEEIAYACVYFLSDASKWVTGASFVIDGGITLI